MKITKIKTKIGFFCFLVMQFLILIFFYNSQSHITKANENNIKALPVSAEFVEDEILVKFKNNIKPQNIVSSLGNNYEAIPYITDKLGIYKVSNLNNSTQEALEIYSQNLNVEFAELNNIIYGTELISEEIEINRKQIGNENFRSLQTNDPFYSTQWAISTLHISEAWDITHGNSSLKIGILDTGINGKHEDLIGQVEQGMDFNNENTQTKKLEPKVIPPNTNSDDNGHGTEIAGVIGALRNNSKGIAGICSNCRLVPIKIMNQDKQTDDVRAAAAIIWATDEKIPILNMSFGSNKNSKTLEMAIEYATKANIILVAASGNENANKLNYPALYTGVISVGASNENNQRCSENDWGKGFGSNYGNGLEIIAPGNSIASTGIKSDNSYVKVSGTSIAAPQIVGITALLLSTDQSLSYKQIIKRFELATGNNRKWISEYGFGIPNAKTVLKYDTKSPGIELNPNQAMPLPAKASFSLLVIDDIQKDNVANEVIDEKTSTIKKVETKFDNLNSQSLFIPADNYGEFRTNIVSDTQLLDGNHKLTITAYDSSNNRQSLVKEFSVNSKITPVSYASPTPSDFVKAPNKLIVEVVKSTDFNLFDSSLNSKFMLPVENVNVKILEKNLTQKTNILGKVYFENLDNGDYTVQCSFEGEVKEQKIAIPKDQYIKIQFTITHQTEAINNIEPPSNPKSGMEVNWILVIVFIIIFNFLFFKLLRKK